MANKLEVVLSVVEEGFSSFKKAMDDFDGLARKTIMLNQAFEAVKNVSGAAKGAFDKLYGSASNIAEAVEKQSQSLNMSTTEMQKWNFVANQNKASTESVTNAFTKLLNTQYEATTGNKAASDAFKDLGVSVTNANGTLKSSDQIINDTMNALSGIENESRRAALAQDVFGKGGKELLPVLAQGTDAINAQKDAAEELGQVMSERAVKNITAMNDAMDRMKTSASIVGAELLTTLLPVLQNIANAATKAASGFSKFIKETQTEEGVLGKRIEVLKKTRDDLIEEGRPLSTALQSGYDRKLGQLNSELAILIQKKNMMDAISKMSKENMSSGTSPIVAAVSGNSGSGSDDKANKKALSNLQKDFEKDQEWIKDDAKARWEIQQKQIKDKKAAEDKSNKDSLNNYKKTNADKLKVAESTGEKAKILTKEEYDAQKAIEDQKRQMMIANGREQLNVLTDVLQQAASKNKAAAVAYKTIAIATTVIDTYSGAQKAFNSLASIPYVGYALGLIAAGATVAAGMMRVNEIRKQQFASGGTSAGGMARVGEMGPEDVYLPSGSQVINHHNTQQMINNKTRNVQLHVTVMGDRGNVSQQFVRELRDSSADYAVKQLYAKMKGLGYAIS